MRTKAAAIDYEASEALEDGEIVAYASTFTRKDTYGDVMQKGSFTKSLEEWRAGKAALPLLWNHDLKDPHNNIGTVDLERTAEDDHGLKVHAKFDLDTRTGAQVHRLVKGRRVTQLSFAYDELAAHPVKGHPAYGDYNSVDEVRLKEISIVPRPANVDAEVLAVKAMEELDQLQVEDPEVRAAVHAALLKAANAFLPVSSGDSSANRTGEDPPAGNGGQSAQKRRVDDDALAKHVALFRALGGGVNPRFLSTT